MGLKTGIEGKGVATVITTEGGESCDDHSIINVEMKWPKPTPKFAQFIPLKLFQQLYAHGHQWYHHQHQQQGWKITHIKLCQLSQIC